MAGDEGKCGMARDEGKCQRYSLRTSTPGRLHGNSIAVAVEYFNTTTSTNCQLYAQVFSTFT